MLQRIETKSNTLTHSIAVFSSLYRDQQHFIQHLDKINEETGLDQLPYRKTQQLTHVAAQLIESSSENNNDEPVAGESLYQPGIANTALGNSKNLTQTYAACIRTFRKAASVTMEQGRPSSELEFSTTFFPEKYSISHPFGSSLIFYSKNISLSQSGISVEKYLFQYSASSRHWCWITLQLRSSVMLDDWKSVMSALPIGLTRYWTEAPRSLRDTIERILSEVDEVDQTMDLALEPPESDRESQPRIILSSRATELHDQSPRFPLASDFSLGSWPFWQEREVALLYRREFQEWVASVNGRLCFYYVWTPDKVETFFTTIKGYHALKDVPGVANFYGLVLDDSRKFVKGYLIESSTSQIAYVGELLQGFVPWERRERWAREFVNIIASVHEKGLQLNDAALELWAWLLDDNDLPVLQKWSTEMPQKINTSGFVPPECRNGLSQGAIVSLQFSRYTDLFHLGSLLWQLANCCAAPMEQDFCRRNECPIRLRTRCHEEHRNPVTLPPCEDPDVPIYYHGLIAVCRFRDPRLRRSAASLLKYFPSQEELNGRLQKCLRDKFGRGVFNVPRCFSSEGVPFMVWCDECGRAIADGIYHCKICNLDNFDLCSLCVEKGVHCFNDTHDLVLTTWRNGIRTIMDKTT